MSYKVSSGFITFSGTTTVPNQEVFDLNSYGIANGSCVSKKTVIILDSSSNICFNKLPYNVLIRDAVEFTETDMDINSIVIETVGTPYYVQCYIG